MTRVMLFGTLFSTPTHSQGNRTWIRCMFSHPIFRMILHVNSWTWCLKKNPLTKAAAAQRHDIGIQMNVEIKIAIASALIAIGILAGFQKIRQYRRDSREALTDDLIDLIFFLPQLIFSAILILIGGGWFYYLLTSA
jgi:hypothetical protein